MKKDFWITRWKEGKTSFHLQNVNELLVQFFPTLEPKTNKKVLVPLCGKSKDMVWLAELGLEVHGVELYEEAVQSFFTENHLPTPSLSYDHDLKSYHSKNIHLHCGDFFKFKPKEQFDLVYDRAALVALPEEMRAPYVTHLLQMMKPGGKYLLITYEYDQNLVEGPPFSVPEKEVIKLYQGQCKIQVLSQRAPIQKGSKLSELESLIEKVTLITKMGS